MTARACALLVAVGLGVATLWLALATQPVLPDYGRQREGWSGDFKSYYLPNAEYAGARLAAGELPLWNPHQALGAPFLATLQVGALYPPNWLHALLPSATAFVVLAFAHLALAAVSAGLLVLGLGGGALGAVLGALVYAGSNQLLASVYSPPLLYAAAWAPLLLLGVDRMLAGGTPLRVALLAIPVAMMLLVGWPYTFAMTALAAALYASGLLAAQVVRTRRVPWKSLAALAAGVLAGVLLAAPQLLPTGELLSRSCRALGSVVERQAIFVDRPHDPEQFWRSFRRLGANGAIPGAAALVLAGFSLLLPGRGRARAGLLLGVGGLALLASFPNHAPVYGWLRELPLLGDFRFPFRYRFVTTLALSVAAGVGTGHLVQALRRWPRVAAGVGVMASFACLATATLPGLRHTLPFPRSVEAAATTRSELAANGAAVSTRDYARVYWAERAVKRGTDTEQDVLYDMEPMSLVTAANLITYFETGRPRTLLSLPHELDAQRLPGDSVAAPFYGHLGIPSDGSRAGILDLLSVRWIVADPAAPGWLAERFQRVSSPGAEFAVYENPRALPRAYRVPAAAKAPKTLRTGLRILASEAFDLRRIALLEDPPRPLLQAAAKRWSDPEASVAIERYEEEEVELSTRGSRPGVVVLSDAWFPGWEATLDGRAVPILRANLFLRGVAVPAGEHRIAMRYRPHGVRAGFALAGLATAGLLLPLVRQRRAARHAMREVRSPQ